MIPMKKVLKVALVALAVLVVLALVVQVVGSSLPREHVASARAVYAAAPEVVYDRIADHESAPSWRPDVTRVERLPDQDGKPVWREESSFGPMTMRVDAAERPTLYRTTIADDALPFGGSWTFELEPADGGTRLTITEDGFIEPAFFRFVARYLAGYNGTKMEYMRDLGRALGEEVTPEELRAR